MNLTRRSLISTVSAAFAYVAIPRVIRAQTVGTPVALTPAQMREDLQYLQTQWAPKDLSFNEQQREIFKHNVEEAVSNTETSSIADFALDIMRAVAIPRNGHTAAMVGNLLGDLPIRMWWFADGLYILSAHPSHVDLVGALVVKIGTLSPDEALELVSPYISGTDQRIRYLSSTYLRCPAVLHRIGAIKEISKATMVLRLRDGTSRMVELDAALTPDPGDTHIPVLNGWSVLIPDDRDMPNRWPHVLDNIKNRSPGYAKPTDFSMRWLSDDEKILYIRSNRLLSQGSDRLDDKLIFVLQNQVVPKQPHSVIIDLRLNNGGNFFNTLLFAQALPKLIPNDGHVFVLISRATFSAAIVTVAMLKGAGGNKVTLIGEPMGDNGHFWAEPDEMTLPNSKIVVFCSTKLEDYEKGCDDLKACYWATTTFGPKNISLQPDVKIDVAFADYAAGKDPVLAKAQSMALE
ncbi:hypothetical protein ACMV8I_19815 [Ewingella sp. S1.OA.A_B6]